MVSSVAGAGSAGTGAEGGAGVCGIAEFQNARMNFLHHREVLFVDAKFQSLLAIFVERKKIKIVVGAAMKDPALIINGGVNEGVGFAAIFGLNVKSNVTDFSV